MCNLVISDALKSAASDVHIEPALHDLQVRMRVDGVLRDYARVPKWLHGRSCRAEILRSSTSRAGLPQDGRVNVQYQAAPSTCASRRSPRISAKRWCCAFSARQGA